MTLRVEIVVPFMGTQKELELLINKKINPISNLDDNFYYLFLWRSTELKSADKIKLSEKYKIIETNFSGIYSALNVYLSETKSQWFIFEGDTDLVYKDVVKNLINKNYNDNPALIIGNVVDENKNKLKPYKLPEINKGANFSSGVIVNTEISKKYRFDNRFKIAGDTNFILNLISNNEKIICSNLILGEFTRDGISSINYKRTVVEHGISLIYNGYIMLGIFFILKRIIKIVIR